MVDQDINLVEGTVAGKPHALGHDRAHHYVAGQGRQHPRRHCGAAGGYESKVDEAGGNFSGGQRQRLEIARALVAPALVFDEATSALDPTTESIIGRQPQGAAAPAYSRSPAQYDPRLRRDNRARRGKVVQRGTHEQMRNVEGPYARLIAAQVREEEREEDAG